MQTNPFTAEKFIWPAMRDDVARQLDEADKEAQDSFDKGKKDAQNHKVFTCSGPRLEGGIFLDVRPESQKQADMRWQQVEKNKR